MIRAVLYIFIALALTAPAYAVTLNTTRAFTGDEIVQPDGTHISLKGIHAPLNATLQVAIDAQNKLGGLIAAQKLRLENGSTDRYGRIAADVYVGDMWLQAEMLRAGLAFVYAPTSDEKLPDLLKAEREARAAKRGIWADKFYADQDANDAREKEGEFAFITGKVLKAARVKNFVYLNFGPDWHEDFTVTIAAHDLRAFRKQDIDPLGFEGKTVRVRGWVRRSYRPEIDVTDPGQIEVLPAP